MWRQQIKIESKVYDIFSPTKDFEDQFSHDRRETEHEVFTSKLDQPDAIICNNFSSSNIWAVLRKYDELKTELKSIYKENEQNVVW